MTLSEGLTKTIETYRKNGDELTERDIAMIEYGYINYVLYL